MGPEEAGSFATRPKLNAVTFHGRVPLDTMAARLAEIDVGVVPTRKDAFLDTSLATKLLESLVPPALRGPQSPLRGRTPSRLGR